VGYTVRLDIARRIVKIAFASRCDADEVTRAVTEARSAAVDGVLGIVYDMRSCEAGGITLTDIFWLPRQHPSLTAESVRRLRIAAVYPDHLEELAQFWETTARNVGIRARAFRDEDLALAWIADSGALA